MAKEKSARKSKNKGSIKKSNEDKRIESDRHDTQGDIEPIGDASLDDVENLSPEVLASLPDGLKSVVIEAQRYQYQGPIPPPAMLKEYEEILPGGADRIFSYAEKSLDIQKNSVDGAIKVASSMVRWSGLTSVLLILCGTATTITALLLGVQPWWGVMIALGGLLGAIIRRVFPERSSNEE